MDVSDIDSDMTDAQHDSASIGLNSQLASLLEFVVQTEQSVARSVKMPCILENVETNQVTAQQRLQDHLSIVIHSINVT